MLYLVLFKLNPLSQQLLTYGSRPKLRRPKLVDFNFLIFNVYEQSCLAAEE